MAVLEACGAEWRKCRKVTGEYSGLGCLTDGEVVVTNCQERNA